MISAALGLVVGTAAVGSIAQGPGSRASPTSSPVAHPSVEPAIMVGAGDIADCSSQADSLTAELIAGTPGTVFTLGDAGPIGRPRDYAVCYEQTWGAELDRTRPVIGDEDYRTNHGAAFFAYFGSRAGKDGYYSFDLASWHVVVLNSECIEVGGCGPGSPQGSWLAQDLQDHAADCTVALFHRPLVSSQGTPDAAEVGPFWDALYAAGAELVLNGHVHVYQRFAPMNPRLRPDPDYGIRQIIAGTGGNTPMLLDDTTANVEAQARAYGVVLLRLYPGRYEWEFVPVRGQTFRDGGGAECHGSPPVQAGRR